jgi:hypothetical protein
MIDKKNIFFGRPLLRPFFILVDNPVFVIIVGIWIKI